MDYLRFTQVIRFDIKVGEIFDPVMRDRLRGTIASKVDGAVFSNCSSTCNDDEAYAASR